MLHLPLISSLFPYTTLFRSDDYIGYYEPDTGFLYSEKAIEAYKKIAIHHGATYIPNTKVEKFYPNKEDLIRSEEHTSELQSRFDLVCRLLLEKKKKEKH